MQLFVQQFINGLSLGAIYALIAVGYTMVYGVLRLINFAHGDVYMFGAMMGLYVASNSFSIIATVSAHPAFWFPAMLVSLFVLGLAGYRVYRNLPLHAALAWLAKIFGAIGVSALAMDLGGRLIRAIGLPSWIAVAVALIVAMIVCAALGMVIELVAYRPLRNQPRISSLITAIGVSMFLEFGGQTIFGVTPQSFPKLAPIAESAINVPSGEIKPDFLFPPPWLSHALDALTHQKFAAVGTVSVGYIDALIMAVTLVLMGVLTWIVLRTRTGMALRAVSFRFDVAALMGIDVDQIVTFTFALGSALAGAAGVLVAMRSPEVNPLMGLMPGIKAFIAAVLGGIGNIPGAVAGGLVLGVVEVMAKAYLPLGSQYSDAIAFVILIAILLVKPTGLFGRNLVEKV